MNKFATSYLIAIIILASSIHGSEFSVMSLNVDNLFDTIDDPGKDDKAYYQLRLNNQIDIKGHATV